MSSPIPIQSSEKPLCPLFGECGGCQYQDIDYPTELQLKHQQLTALISQDFPEWGQIVETVFPSPQIYHYRCRLDMKFLRTKAGKILMGFTPAHGRGIIEVGQCPLALSSIDEFLPRLKEEATQKLTPKYRNANLVIKAGSQGPVRWGGIGKRSLHLQEKDYLWAEIEGQRIHFSLDTFFQANLSILSGIVQSIKNMNILDAETTFYDLYGGVGLFGFTLAPYCKNVVLVEENIYSTEVAHYNKQHLKTTNVDIISARVEDVIHQLSFGDQHQPVAMIDPPRNGLSLSVAQALANTASLSSMMYLSCHPESLIRDLKILITGGWEIDKIKPFDFFPRTRHIETLVVLRKRKK